MGVPATTTGGGGGEMNLLDTGIDLLGGGGGMVSQPG